MAYVPLPHNDCHHDPRNYTIKQTHKEADSNFCLSIAWDWMNKCYTEEGMMKQNLMVYETSMVNRRNNIQSLAPHETALMSVARSMSLNEFPNQKVVQGLKPTLQKVLESRKDASNKIQDLGDSLVVVDIHSTNAEASPTHCTICNYEISNLWMKCQKCQGEYQFCLHCFNEEGYKQNKGRHKGKTGVQHQKLHLVYKDQSMSEECEMIQKLLKD